jgi:hypothetical protein
MGHALRAVRRALRRPAPRVSAAEVLAALERLGPLERSDLGNAPEAPVFVLSTGWRTGSTLLQRILMTDRRVLLWGEPLGRMGLVSRLAEAVCGMRPGWPPEEFWIDRRAPSEDPTTAWIANLFPPAVDFRAALRSLVERWLVVPARERGFVRWGLKEVRLGSPEAVLLRWLYPAACLVVLTRDPLAAYRSIRGSAPDWVLYARWPDRRVDDAVTFARHWNALAASWAEDTAPAERLVIRYEDLVRPGYDFRPLASFVSLELAPEKALGSQVGGASREVQLGALETMLVRRETVTGRRVMGYRP